MALLNGNQAITEWEAENCALSFSKTVLQRYQIDSYTTPQTWTEMPPPVAYFSSLPTANLASLFLGSFNTTSETVI